MLSPNLSIIIPTYNTDCSALVAALHGQCEDLRRHETDFDYEIIVGDDGSTDRNVVHALQSAAENGYCRVIRSENNVGRAAIRNMLLDNAGGQWIILTDSDAETTEGYIAGMWSARNRADVICGAVLTPEGPPQPGHELRWRYEWKAVQQGRRTAKWRNAHPYDSFATFNVMLSRKVLGTLRFDQQRCREYGFEDVLFGLELKRNSFSILHTDYGLIHLGINSNKDFLKNTEASLRVLYGIEDDVAEGVRLVQAARKLRRNHLDGLARFLFRTLRKHLLRNLNGRRPKIWLFNFYKLGYYLNLC